VDDSTSRCALTNFEEAKQGDRGVASTAVDTAGLAQWLLAMGDSAHDERDMVKSLTTDERNITIPLQPSCSAASSRAAACASGDGRGLGALAGDDGPKARVIQHNSPAIQDAV
jgi:hypothetical protein